MQPPSDLQLLVNKKSVPEGINRLLNYFLTYMILDPQTKLVAGYTKM